MRDDGLGFPDWLGGLIASAGTAVAGGIATRIATGPQLEATRAVAERSLAVEYEMRRIEATQQTEMIRTAGLGLAALVLISLIR